MPLKIDAEGANVLQLKTFLPEATKRPKWIFHSVFYLQKVLVLSGSFCSSALKQSIPL